MRRRRCTVRSHGCYYFSPAFALGSRGGDSDDDEIVEALSRARGEGGKEKELKQAFFFFCQSMKMRCGKSRAGGWQWWSERWLSRAKRGGKSSALLGG